MSQQHILRRGVRRYALGDSTFTVDPRVIDWVNRVTNNGGASPSIATQSALSTFFQGLTSTGLLQKIVMLNCVVPDSLIATATALIRGGSADPWINHSFVSGDLTVNGLIGDGASKYLDTGFTPSGVKLTDVALTVYVSANSTNAAEVDFGCQSGGTQILALYPNYGGTTYWDCFTSTSGSGRISAVNTGFLGYVSGNRGVLGGGVIQAVYTANSTSGHTTLVSSTTSAGGSAPTTSLFAWAYNNNGPAIAWSVKRLSFIAVHSGMTSADSLNFYNAIQALRVALGGGFV